MSNSIFAWPCRVLLVDENDAFLDGLTDWFEDHPKIHIVGRAHSREEVLSRFSILKPDVVLIDTGIPDGNGFDVVRFLKVDPKPPLVIMMSFHDSDHIQSTALSSGANGCITKADVPEKLFPSIEASINRQDPDSNPPRIQKNGD